MKFIKEFKEFAIKGNVIDMAVGVIIGGAFGKIVSSLVNDIIMPAISLLLGKIDLSKLAIVIEKQGADPIVIGYGMFLQNVIDFLIIALCIFMFVKLSAKLKRKEEEKPVEPPKPSNEEVLLAEIRDILANKERTDEE